MLTTEQLDQAEEQDSRTVQAYRHNAKRVALLERALDPKDASAVCDMSREASYRQELHERQEAMARAERAITVTLEGGK